MMICTLFNLSILKGLKTYMEKKEVTIFPIISYLLLFTPLYNGRKLVSD